MNIDLRPGCKLRFTSCATLAWRKTLRSGIHSISELSRNSSACQDQGIPLLVILLQSYIAHQKTPAGVRAEGTLKPSEGIHYTSMHTSILYRIRAVSESPGPPVMHTFCISDARGPIW
jgi:hypothetical protein